MAVVLGALLGVEEWNMVSMASRSVTTGARVQVERGSSGKNVESGL